MKLKTEILVADAGSDFYVGRSGRRYPKSAIREKMNEFLSSKDPILGTIEDFTDTETPVTLANATHKVTGAEMTDEPIVVEAEILDTEMGRRLIEVMTNGLTVELEPRWTGHTDEDGMTEVTEIETFLAVPRFGGLK